MSDYPEEIEAFLLQILQESLTNIKSAALANDPDFCFTEAYHTHNVPGMLRYRSWSGISRYLTWGPTTYAKEYREHFHSSPAMFEPLWQQLEQALRAHEKSEPQTATYRRQSSECPEDVYIVVLKILTDTLLNIRMAASGDSAELCLMAVNHILALPNLLSHFTWEKLANYLKQATTEFSQEFERRFGQQPASYQQQWQQLEALMPTYIEAD